MNGTNWEGQGKHGNPYDERGVEFCEYVKARIDQDPSFSSKIAFFNEATFELNATL